jgi:hypothetical protein
MLLPFIHSVISPEKQEKKENYDNDCTRIFPQNLVLQKLVIFQEPKTMRDEIRRLLIRFKMAYESFLTQVTDFETFMQTHFLAISLSFDNILHKC